jgi:hypothetical protein
MPYVCSQPGITFKIWINRKGKSYGISPEGKEMSSWGGILGTMGNIAGKIPDYRHL